MDQNTTIEEVKETVRLFCEEREWDRFHSPKELAIGISTEANELLAAFRFQTEEQMKTLMETCETRTQIEDELADTFFFLLRFAQKNQIDLSAALANKMQKNAKRYSVERSRGNNRKFDMP